MAQIRSNAVTQEHALTRLAAGSPQAEQKPEPKPQDDQHAENEKPDESE